MVHKINSGWKLPDKKYQELLGLALCVFGSNTSFIIENILSTAYWNPVWYSLIDAGGKKVLKSVRNIITGFTGGDEICELYEEIASRRSRITSSYKVVSDDRQSLCSVDKKNREQFVVTEEYLSEFILMNEELRDKLSTLQKLMHS